MISTPEDISRKSPFKKITKCEGGHRLKNHPRNPSQNSSKCINHTVRIGRGTAWSPWTGSRTNHIPHCNWERFPAPGRPPQAAPVPTNTDAAEIPRYIQIHADQVDQRLQMVNAEDILKQQLLGSLEEIYFKGKHQAYINYTNCILAGLIQHLYDDHGTISPMEIE